MLGDRIGILKTHESTRKLARHLERGTGRILSATITHTAGRWYVVFTCELTRQLPTSNGRVSTVGVDVGIRHLARVRPAPSMRKRRLPRAWIHRDDLGNGSLLNEQAVPPKEIP